MFSLIDGGFQVAIKDLFTMDLSWLFTTCFLAITNVLAMITMFIGKAKTIVKKKKK